MAARVGWEGKRRLVQLGHSPGRSLSHSAHPLHVCMSCPIARAFLPSPPPPGRRNNQHQSAARSVCCRARCAPPLAPLRPPPLPAAPVRSAAADADAGLLSPGAGPYTAVLGSLAAGSAQQPCLLVWAAAGRRRRPLPLAAGSNGGSCDAQGCNLARCSTIASPRNGQGASLRRRAKPCAPAGQLRCPTAAGELADAAPSRRVSADRPPAVIRETPPKRCACRRRRSSSRQAPPSS